MATAEKLTENYLTCIICSEVYTDPATLQCDHTFCRSCLLKYTKTQQNAIEAKAIPCPCCRQLTRVTSPGRPVDEWVNQVKLSRLMQGLMDDFCPGTGMKDTDLCEACKNEGETTSATSWCQECGESLCDNCVRMHRRFSITRSHQVSSLSGDSKKIKKRRFMCTEHKEQIKLFCKDCNKTLCSTCSKVEHRQCNSVVTLESVMQKVTTTLKKREKKLNQKINEKTKLILELNEWKEQIEQNARSTEWEIKEVTQKVIDKIKQKEEKLLIDLTNEKKRLISKVKSDKKSEEIELQRYQQKLKFTGQAIKSECLEDMFTVYESRAEPLYVRERTMGFGFHGILYKMFSLGRLRRGDRCAFMYDMELLNKAVDGIELGKIRIT